MFSPQLGVTQMKTGFSKILLFVSNAMFPHKARQSPRREWLNARYAEQDSDIARKCIKSRCVQPSCFQIKERILMNLVSAL